MSSEEEREQEDLCSVAKVGDLEAIKRMIEEEKQDINYAVAGNTALHWAAYFDHIECAKYLVHKGADLEARNKKEAQTPLHWACVGGSLKVFLYLVQEGADIHYGDKRGYTALMHCAQYNRTISAYKLLSVGAPIAAKDNFGHTALHWASYQNHEPMARLLLSKGANINAQDDEGLSPLHWAALKGHFKMVNFLVVNGANASLVDKDGYTASETARQKKMTRTAQYLQRSEKFNHNHIEYYAKFWGLVPWLCIPTVFWFLCNYGFFVSLLVLIVLIFCLRRYLSFSWLPVERKNPFFMCFFMSSYWMSVYCFATKLTIVIDEYPVMVMFWMLINACWGFFYLYVCWGDPGSIPKQPGVVEQLIIDVQNGKDIPQVCASCLTAKPLRSKHCRTCDRCCARFDHHCTWINNCVGQKNHVNFIICLVVVIFLFGSYQIVTYHVLNLQPDAVPWWSLHVYIPVSYTHLTLPTNREV
eukprot:TRINITY_DN4949_c0_g1_i2.p1 TRINITY_DN4949_c0_g1~~TRINITY_DN4949_c0_g1_i2.p1  ORF type:complete len:472 (+),score=32.92 TRINITY_DN4949_c0_g1_i2:849-2264(+)